MHARMHAYVGSVCCSTKNAPLHVFPTSSIPYKVCIVLQMLIIFYEPLLTVYEEVFFS